MARSFYRPFTKVLDLAADTSYTVDLTDSAGQTLKCNFVSLECSAAGTTGQHNFVLLSASSLASGTNAFDSVVGGSGTLGVVAQSNGGVAQLPLGLANGVENVGLQVSGETTFAILTYGNVMVGNTLKDSQRPQGF
jgi:hypothetical protein